MHSILIVDDEEPMRELLKVNLIAAGYRVEEAKNGMEALDKVKSSSNYNMMIVDWMMPFMDGVELTKRIREFSSVPILMLTARNETVEKVKGFSYGADDYVTKPFESAELLARVQAILRRSPILQQESMDHLLYKGISLNPKERMATLHGDSVELTQSEFEILWILTMHPSQIFGRSHLIELIWGQDSEGDERTIDSHIRNLRGKLKKIGAGDYIKTVWGAGYKLQ